MGICTGCNRYLTPLSEKTDKYSPGLGVPLCPSCDHKPHSDTPSSLERDGARYNNSSHCTIPFDSFDTPFAKGAFRFVAKGMYTEGPRKGEACAVKWFKTGAVYSEDYFALDIKAVRKALELVQLFNQSNRVNKTVKINVAQVWQILKGAKKEFVGQKLLCEPFIKNYENFNSNTGWNDDTRAWGEVMQALSHYSYHVSGGAYVLCDLQGGVYKHEVVLSDPVILSRSREFGVTDLGEKGISSFFSQHTCNSFCHPRWNKPVNPYQWFAPVPGTTMTQRTVSTAMSRPQGSIFG